MAWPRLLLLPCLVASTRAAWTLTQPGTTGIGAMQMTVVGPDTVMIIDKLESNPLSTDQGTHALGAIYSLKTNTVRPLNGITTNSFCAGGGWLSNGTMVNMGGNPLVKIDNSTAQNGLQGVRLFNPCNEGEKCDVYEDAQRIRLTSSRWYPSGARLSDGSLLIIGGAFGGGWTNNPQLNNPTYEFYPPKNINGFNGLQIPSKFLVDTLPHNLFPHVFALPNGQVFVAANNKTMMLDWQRNLETRLPDLPNGQRCTYPMSGTAIMLPLRYENGWAPEIIICGGSEVSDTVPETELSTTTPASAQCSRMVLNASGIRKGWQVEKMPQARMMPDSLLLPDGKVLILNGAAGGTAGYGNVQNQAQPGQRFSNAGLPTSDIARMYHSVATLTPKGTVLIAGSNPNDNVETRMYPTEFRAEILSPDYLSKPRATMVNYPQTLRYARRASATISMPLGRHKRGFFFKKVEVVLMDLGFSTHGVHMDQRMVTLPAVMMGRKLVTFTGPPNANVYPPGPAWLYIVIDGVPTEGMKVMVGDGQSPPVDPGAIANMLAKTGNP
ncbi:glyoxal oxidase [Ceratobasidium sp. AG-Ba]|nr:glyoxal oxidase [Ceratobasidium sp. AG-Ba]